MDVTPPITVERRSHVAIVWLDRPDQRNALAPEFWTTLPGIMEDIGDDPHVRVAVVAAKGPAFTVGLDLTSFGATMITGSLDPAAPPPASPVAQRAQTRKLVKTMQRTFSSLAECAVPVIAAPSDRPTAVGTLQRLPRIIDPGSVAELAYTGRDFDAGEAASLGLVTRVLPDRDAALAAALETAELIAANSPLAVQGTKAVLQAGESKTVGDALDYVALWSAAFLHSNDLAEAMASFVERRPPEFKGE